MEVHTHTHTTGKKWTHYLWEFLMLFLAVFCGFLAENVRERQVEHHREKQYMLSLVKDLQLDTAVLENSASLKDQRGLAIDSLLEYFSNNMEVKKVSLSALRQMRRSQWDMFFIHHSGTVDQLKNSGSLRLIRNTAIVDSIESYYQQVQRSESRNSMYFDNQQAGYSLFEKLVSASDNIKYYKPFAFRKYALPDSGSVAINPAYLNEYLNMLIRVRIIAANDRQAFTLSLKDDATRLIALIKKEYEL